MTPPLPRGPGPRRQPPTVAVGLMAVLMVSLGFLAMAAAVMPQFLLMVLVGLGMVLFFAVQYFAWARWLYPRLVRAEQERQALAESRGVTNES